MVALAPGQWPSVFSCDWRADGGRNFCFRAQTFSLLDEKHVIKKHLKTFLTMIRISLMNYFVPNVSQYSEDLRAATETTHVDPALPGPLSASNTFHFRVGWK